MRRKKRRKKTMRRRRKTQRRSGHNDSTFGWSRRARRVMHFKLLNKLHYYLLFVGQGRAEGRHQDVKGESEREKKRDRESKRKKERTYKDRKINTR